MGSLLLPQVYVEYVVFNPMCPLNKPIESELFAAKLDEVVRQSPAYASRPAWGALSSAWLCLEPKPYGIPAVISHQSPIWSVFSYVLLFKKSPFFFVIFFQFKWNVSISMGIFQGLHLQSVWCRKTEWRFRGECNAHNEGSSFQWVFYNDIIADLFSDSTKIHFLHQACTLSCFPFWQMKNCLKIIWHTSWLCYNIVVSFSITQSSTFMYIH